MYSRAASIHLRNKCSYFEDSSHWPQKTSQCGPRPVLFYVNNIKIGCWSLLPVSVVQVRPCTCYALFYLLCNDLLFFLCFIHALNTGSRDVFAAILRGFVLERVATAPLTHLTSTEQPLMYTYTNETSSDQLTCLPWW